MAFAAHPRHGRLLNPEVLASLSNLELVARTVVEGTLIGLHRSPRFGFSQEFAEYAAYEPGDDLRHLDWNALARTDRAYIKRYFGDTNHQVMVVLDSSASMVGTTNPDVGTRSGAAYAVAKWDYARFVSAALVYLAARQHDAVGLACFADEVDLVLPPRTRPRHVEGLFHQLEARTCGGATNWEAAFQAVAMRLHKRTLVVMVSDFYTPLDTLSAQMAELGSRGHELVFVQVLDAGERDVDLTGVAALVDAESGETMMVSAEEVRSDYAARLEAHRQGVRRLVEERGGHYLGVYTDEPLDRMLADYLRFRTRYA